MAKDELELEDNLSEENDESCDGEDDCPTWKETKRKKFAMKSKGRTTKKKKVLPKKESVDIANVRTLSGGYNTGDPNGAYGGGAGNVPESRTRKLWAKKVAGQ